MSTQKNPKFVVLEDTPYGKLFLTTIGFLNDSHQGFEERSHTIAFAGRYVEAEVEGGGFSRDVMEFLVKQDVVAYRCMATKVTFVYPFTTAFGDSKGQEERLKKLIDQLGWYAPTFESME